MRKLTTEQFIEDVLCKDIHPDGKYNYKFVEYINNLYKIEIYCNICKKCFWQSPSNHKQGSGCPRCVGCKKLTIDEIKQYLTIDEEPIEVDGVIQCRCTYCKKYFTPTRSQILSRIGCLSGKQGGEKRLYCSNTCKNLCPIYWKSKYPEDTITDISRPVQPELRQITLERDKYQCQRCGSTIDLHCHHFEGIELTPVESADIDNCIILCDGCHKKAHLEPGCTYNDFKRKPCII